MVQKGLFMIQIRPYILRFGLLWGYAKEVREGGISTLNVIAWFIICPSVGKRD